MTYNTTKYAKWRSLDVNSKLALALSDDLAPQGKPMASVLGIPTPGSATAPTCAAKINELLAALRASGLLT